MPFPIIPVVAGAFGIANTLINNRQQRNTNDRAFGMSVKQEQKIFERDSAYNSPEAQMQRLRDAGLSPHLMYGQGTVGNTSGSNVQAQPYQVKDYLSVPEQVSQAFAIDRTVKLKDAEIKLKAAQEELVRANPYLSPTYVQSMVDNIRAMADLNMKERDIMLSVDWYDKGNGEVERSSFAYQKMTAELESLWQRLNLNQEDLKIRAEILQSKAFENALKEIEVRFMQEGDMSPKHWLEFAKILLQKMGK